MDVLAKIGKQLAGVNCEDMTTAERRIAAILTDKKILKKNLDGTFSFVYNGPIRKQIEE